MKKSTIKTAVALLCVTAVGVAPVFASTLFNNVSTSNSNSTSSSSSTSVSYAMGDVNRDGSINLKDAKLVLGASLGVEEPQYKLDAEQIKLADYDNNGKIDLRDARTQLKASLGIEDK